MITHKTCWCGCLQDATHPCPMGEVLIRFLTDEPSSGSRPIPVKYRYKTRVFFVLSHTNSAAIRPAHLPNRMREPWMRYTYVGGGRGGTGDMR